MCRSKVRNVDFLLQYCAAIGAIAPASFWAASEEVLTLVHRIRPPFMLGSFSASALVLDWEYAQHEKSFIKFTAANYRLAVNVIKEAAYDYDLLSVFAGIPIGILYEIFGWSLYKKGTRNGSNCV